jgi:hypothetical protein
MGTVIATLLLAETSTIRVNATNLRVASKWSIQPSPAPRRFVSNFLAVCGESPASRGVLFHTWPEKVGRNEVNP